MNDAEHRNVYFDTDIKRNHAINEILNFSVPWKVVQVQQNGERLELLRSVTLMTDERGNQPTLRARISVPLFLCIKPNKKKQQYPDFDPYVMKFKIDNIKINPVEPSEV